MIIRGWINQFMYTICESTLVVRVQVLSSVDISGGKIDMFQYLISREG